jgi:hypothetical protein
MNRFIIELTDFEYPKQQLFDYQDNNPAYEANIHFKSGYGYDTAKESKFFDLNGSKCEEANKLVESLGLEEYKFTKVLAGGAMPAHIDPQRDAVLMLPLTDEPSPIVYYENSVEVFRHTYTKPTIINAKIKHGVPVVTRDRIFLQINLHDPWNEIYKRFSRNRSK